MIHIAGPKTPEKQGIPLIDTTSRSKTWSRGLSPFKLGPVNLYVPYKAKNVENAWQFSKVYLEHINDNGDPSDEYFKWALTGWNDYKAHRYPMGKGAIPEYSWWDGKRLSYLEARKQIYIPLYSKAVLKSPVWPTLVKVYQENEHICLWDFDGYDYHNLNMSLKDVINDPYKKMGHAFVLALLLEAL